VSGSRFVPTPSHPEPPPEGGDMSQEPLPSQFPKSRKLRIAAAYYATFVLLGLMLTAIGPSLDALQVQSGASTEAIALLFAANSLGYIAGSLLAGQVYARFPGNRVLAAALLLLALLTLTVPWLRSPWLLMLAFGLIGLPLGLMDVGCNTLLVWLFRDKVPPYMNALHLCFGIGAFLGPLVFDRFAVATGNAVTTFWLLAALMVPVAVWVGRESNPDGASQAAPEGRSALRHHAWIIGLIALFFFMHMGGEMAFGGWIYTYANEAIGSETTARVVNSVFWGGLVVGRIIAVPLAVRLSPRAMLQLDLVGVVSSLAVLVAFPGSIPALWIGTIGFGLSIASMIPSSFNLAGKILPITSRVSSTFVVAGGLGTMTLPWLVGQLFAPYGRLSVPYVTGAAMLAASCVFVFIVRNRRRAAGSEPTRETGWSG
jgi:MFS transporter, FHS family, Na+ dependent glucose transporter 1